MNNLFRRVEFLANIALITLALLLGAVLVKRYLLHNPQPNQVIAEPQVKVGTKLSMEGVDWAKNQRTLLLALSTNCRFCTESAPFYQRLAEARSRSANVKLLAVLPQELSESQKYLSDHGIIVDDIKQAMPSTIGVAGTPTLIMTDSDGIVTKSWVGKLPAEREGEVLSWLQ